jgi:hypothetical protein
MWPQSAGRFGRTPRDLLRVGTHMGLSGRSKLGGETWPASTSNGMDIHAAVEEVARWCAEQTAARDPDRIEVEAHAMVSITLAECAPLWRVRFARRSSAGASSPIAQLRYDCGSRRSALHHGQRPEGWCSDDDAVHARELGPLLDQVARDRDGRFPGLPPIFWE